MRNILLVIAMLVIAMPALATVSVTATDKGSGVVEVRYNCSASERVRSFALDISVDSGYDHRQYLRFQRRRKQRGGARRQVRIRHIPGQICRLYQSGNPQLGGRKL